MKVKKRLVFLGSIDFNGNSAAANRIRYYSRAILLEGCESYYLELGCTFSGDKSINKVEPGIFEGNKVRNNRYLEVFRSIKSLQNDTIYNTQFIVYPSTNILFMVFVFALQLFRMFNFFVEVNEHRVDDIKESLLQLNHIKCFYKYLKKKFQLLLFQSGFYERIFKRSLGLICISTRIQSYYSRLNTSSIRIPILTECNESINVLSKKTSDKRFKICFAGTISKSKEYIDEFILSVKDLNEEGYNISFDLFGQFPPERDEMRFKMWLKENNCTNFVNYKGVISNFKLLEEYKKYDVLFLLRKKTKQNDYGFSTKLATYLISGVPVMATLVSDMDYYLEGKDCIYEFPHDVSRFKELMIEMIDQYDKRADEITKNAYQIANINFNYTKYGKVLTSFLFKNRE